MGGYHKAIVVEIVLTASFCKTVWQNMRRTYHLVGTSTVYGVHARMNAVEHNSKDRDLHVLFKIK